MSDSDYYEWKAAAAITFFLVAGWFGGAFYTATTQRPIWRNDGRLTGIREACETLELATDDPKVAEYCEGR